MHTGMHACENGRGQGGRTAHVLRGGLVSHENDALAPKLPRLCVCRAEDGAADGGARGGGETAADDGGRVRLGVFELRVQELVEVAGLDHHHRLLLGDQALPLHSTQRAHNYGTVYSARIHSPARTTRLSRLDLDSAERMCRVRVCGRKKGMGKAESPLDLDCSPYGIFNRERSFFGKR